MSFFIPNLRRREGGEAPAPESARVVERLLEQANPGWTPRQASTEFLSIPFPSESCPIGPKVWFQNEVIKSLLFQNTAVIQAYGKDFRREILNRTTGKSVGGFDSTRWQTKAMDYWIGIEAVLEATADEHRHLRGSYPTHLIETAFMNELDEKSKIDALMFAIDPAGTNHDLRLIQTKATSLKGATADTVAAVVDAHRKWLESLPRAEAVEEYLHGKEALAMVRREMTLDPELLRMTQEDRVLSLAERLDDARLSLERLGISNGGDRPRIRKFATELTPQNSVDLRLLFARGTLDASDLEEIRNVAGIASESFARLVRVLCQWSEDSRVSTGEIAAANPAVRTPFPPRVIQNVRSVIWHGRNRALFQQPATLVVPLTYRP